MTDDMRARSLSELMDLRGRVALVTGGAGHIGAAFVDTLAEMGERTIVLDLDEADPTAVARRVEERHGVESVGVAADLEVDREIDAVPTFVDETFGRLDILVNCAALVGAAENGGWNVPFAEQSRELWRRALEVNLTAAFALSQACAPLLRASGNGVIVNVGSIYGSVGPDLSLYEDTGMSNPAGYAASKGGLIQLTRWLATALAPEIRVNCLSPGGVERGQDRAFVARYEARTPLGRMAREEDLKGALAYLASDLSAYVTGQNLSVDGGWTAW